MRLTMLLVSLLIAICNNFTSAYAQENRGVSWILQMCSEKTDCSTISAAYKDASVVNAGWLYLTSNPNRCKCAPTLLKDPRPKRVRIDICNSTCFPERGRHCEAQECFAGMNTNAANNAILKNDKKTFARIDKAISIARSDVRGVGGLELAVKPCLECTLSSLARGKLNEYVKGKFSDMQSARFVDNPINDKCQAGWLCEKHGAPQGGANLISDNDGLDYDTIDQYGYWKQNKQSYMTLAWKVCNNGLKKGDSYKPGVARTDYCGVSRDLKDFASATATNAATVQSPLDPADKVGCQKWLKAPDGKKNFVLKLGDGRSFAVFLSPANISKNSFKKVELRRGGKVIDSSAPNRPGKRFGLSYAEDPSNARRRIYDFQGHPNTYPDHAVLHADGYCWDLEKPRFRVD